MELTLTIKTDDMRGEELDELTRELSAELNQEVAVEASLPDETGGAGSKGDPITVGTIILLLLGGGGVAAKLIEVLKAYVDRGNKLEFEFKKPDGTSLSLKTENFSQRDVKELSSDLSKFFGAHE
jgi:hypothetical protein